MAVCNKAKESLINSGVFYVEQNHRGRRTISDTAWATSGHVFAVVKYVYLLK